MPGHATFYWNELMTRDVEAAKRFFSETVGWTFDAFPIPEGTYWVAKLGDKAVGGVMEMPRTMPNDVPRHWMSYLEVDDIDARLKKAEAAGGKVLMQPFDVKDVGRIAILKDPAGAVVGWITPVKSG
ncbi:MAG: VOC family protein [Hyphomicrobiaceae bacterium]